MYYTVVPALNRFFKVAATAVPVRRSHFGLTYDRFVQNEALRDTLQHM